MRGPGPARRPRARLVLVLALAASGGVLAGCQQGHDAMMGAWPTRFTSNGERIYFTGTSASGEPIAYRGGSMHLRMMGGGCATCHGPDRQGRRMMPWFWKVAPPLTAEALFGEHGDGDGHGEHEAYDDESLRRAVFRGIDPSGEPLDELMPRWSMSERDWQDLLAWLKTPAAPGRG